MQEMTPKKLREFAFLTGGVFVLLFGLLIPWLKSKPYPLWPWIIAIALALPALIAPQVLKPVHTAWMKLGHALGWVNSRIILGIVFYGVITPMSLLMKLFKKNPLSQHEEKKVEGSYRINVTRREGKHMEVPY